MKIINKIKKDLKKIINTIDNTVTINVEKSKVDGDFSTNVAMILSNKLKRNTIEIAQEIVDQMDHELYDKVEIAKPGFINMYVNSDVFSSDIEEINEEKNNYGKGKNNKYINVEYVSANPTGHLHVGHARGAVYGNILINILRFDGNKVDSEYYVNDAGNQINILGEAVFTRYKQQLGVDIQMPEDTYKGQEIIDIAADFVVEFGTKYMKSKYSEVAEIFKTKAKLRLLEKIKKHLHALGVDISVYTSEEKLIKSGAVTKTLQKMGDAVYIKDGATWVKTQIKGDDKDRVVIKSDGINSYFGSDIANHEQKMQKGYDKLIDIWGSDHVGQVKRLVVSLEYLGYRPGTLVIPMTQLVKLLKNGKELKMSKRAGTAFRLIDLVEEFGQEASRWYMVSKANDSQFTLDINYIKENWENSPLFMVQYAHARANQLIKKAKSNIPEQLAFGPTEKALLVKLSEYQALIASIAENYKVHLLPKYLMECAKTFNSWYSNNKVIGSKNEASLIELTKASKQIIFNGLSLLGIEAKDEMKNK